MYFLCSLLYLKMIYSVCLYNNQKDFFFLRSCADIKDRRAVHRPGIFLWIGYKLLWYFHNYALSFISITTMATYAWFIAAIKYINSSTALSCTDWACPFLLAALIVFYEKYRGSSKAPFRQCIWKISCLLGLSLAMCSLMGLIIPKAPESPFVKYFVLEEAFIYNGVLLHSVNYSNIKKLQKVIISSAVLYFLGIYVFFLYTTIYLKF